MSTLNEIKVVNSSGLDPATYTVWVAGYMADAEVANKFYILGSDGGFASPTAATDAPFINVNNGLTIDVPDVTNSGNNRLVFVVTTEGEDVSKGYPVNGYTAWPFNNAPGVCPPGPYDIFEFGPNAQYDVSAVDAFGINLSFTVEGDASTYGPRPAVARAQIGTAFQTFMTTDPYGSDFTELFYTSPTGPDYPDQIDGQFSAIVSPKDWLAIYPTATGLNGYWTDTVNAFFTSGNQLDFFLNAASVGNYKGPCDGTEYKLKGPGVEIAIPKSDFAGNQPFVQAVNNPYSGTEAAVYGQIEAALFEAFSRGVALDGVKAKGDKISENYSSDAWTNMDNWFTDHKNSYNQNASVYDAYAKFFHFASVDGTVGGDTIFAKNSSGKFGMAYGFSLDENPNVGSTVVSKQTNPWPAADNVPSKTLGNVGSQTVTLTVGPWATS